MFRSFTQEQHGPEALSGITDETRGKDGLRSSQLAQVLDDVHQSGSDTPVVIAGDFNFDLSQESRPPLPSLAPHTLARRFKSD